MNVFQHYIEDLNFRWLEYWLRESYYYININEPLNLFSRYDNRHYLLMRPIFFVIINGKYDIIHLLIDYNVEINCYSQYYVNYNHPLNFATPLYFAIYFRHYDIARLLVERGGADVNAKSNSLLETPLMRAINNEQFCHYLIKTCNANVNEFDKNNCTALYHALTHFYYNTAVTLIKLGAYIYENILIYIISQIFHDEKINNERYKLRVFEELMKNIHLRDVVANAYELFSLYANSASVKMYCRRCVDALRQNEIPNIKYYDKFIHNVYYYNNMLIDIIDQRDGNIVIVDELLSFKHLPLDKRLYAIKLKELTLHYYYNNNYVNCERVFTIAFEFSCLNKIEKIISELLDFLLSSPSLLNILSFEYVYNILNHLLTKKPNDVYHILDASHLLRIILLCIDKYSSFKQLEALKYIIKSFLKPLNVKVTSIHFSLIHFLTLRLNGNNATKDLLKILLECGMDVNSLDNFGKTPLYYCHNEDDAKILLKYHGHCIPKNYLSKHLLSLKCLSARAIQHYKISYDDVPRDLIEFIQYHNNNNDIII